MQCVSYVFILQTRPKVNFKFPKPCFKHLLQLLAMPKHQPNLDPGSSLHQNQMPIAWG